MNTRNTEEHVKVVNGLYLSPIGAKNIDILEDEYGATIERHHDPSGFCYRIHFKNKPYGVSVIKSYYSYGGSRDQFELAVLNSNGDLCYTTQITEDVIGFLEEEDLMAMLRLIYRLDHDGKISQN